MDNSFMKYAIDVSAFSAGLRAGKRLSLSLMHSPGSHAKPK